MAITFPTPQTQRELAEALHLGTDASADLWSCVRQLVGDIARHAAMQANQSLGRNRTERIKHLKAVSNGLSKLETRLLDQDRNTDEILRLQLSTLLGEIISHSGFERLVGCSPGYDVGSRFPPARSSARDTGLYEALESEMLQRRINLATVWAPTVLVSLIREINQPLRRYLDLERLNKGGSPGRTYRNYAVAQLIPVHPKIFGEPPTPAPNGNFVTLCDWVLTAVGIETDGLEQAVARILSGSERR